MTKSCDLTGKNVLVGNSVSHSKRKTKKRFLPNIQNIALFSDILNQNFSFKLATSTIRTISAKGSLDEFLISSAVKDLTAEGQKIKKRIARSLEQQAATSSN